VIDNERLIVASEACTEPTVAHSPVDPESLPALAICLEYGDSPAEECKRLPRDLYARFTAPGKVYSGYGFLQVNVAILVLPDDIERDWWGSPQAKWMRQKVRRATKLGYEFRPFEHDDHRDEIYAINTSLPTRQGGRMSEAYRTPPADEPPSTTWSCPRHRRAYHGVFKDGRLYAYANVVQCGEAMIFSRLLGHGEHLDDGIVNLLVYEAARHCRRESATRYAVYHLADNGTEGLQFFKRKMGFIGHRVQWELARPGVRLSERRSPALALYAAGARRWPALRTLRQALRKAP
jgi:hypothetical protein